MVEDKQLEEARKRLFSPPRQYDEAEISDEDVEEAYHRLFAGDADRGQREPVEDTVLEEVSESIRGRR